VHAVGGLQLVVVDGLEALLPAARASDEEGAAKDVGIASAALRVEHYEVAGYTAAIGIAKQLGEREMVSLLTETLNEEKDAGKKVLTQSKPLISQAASEGEEEEDEEEEGEDEEYEEDDEEGEEDEEEGDEEEEDEEEQPSSPAKKGTQRGRR